MATGVTKSYPGHGTNEDYWAICDRLLLVVYLLVPSGTLPQYNRSSHGGDRLLDVILPWQKVYLAVTIKQLVITSAALCQSNWQNDII